MYTYIMHNKNNFKSWQCIAWVLTIVNTGRSVRTMIKRRSMATAGPGPETLPAIFLPSKYDDLPRTPSQDAREDIERS